VARSSASPAGNPTGLLLANPNAGILYSTSRRGPKLPLEYQVNSTRHFMRDLNRLASPPSSTRAGGFQNYPRNYEVIQRLHDAGSSRCASPTTSSRRSRRRSGTTSCAGRRRTATAGRRLLSG
jgi:hypothetical protein